MVRELIYPLDLWRQGDLAKWKYLREFERSQYLPEASLRAIQLGRLKKLWEHAYHQCPLYRERMGTRRSGSDGSSEPRRLEFIPIALKT